MENNSNNEDSQVIVNTYNIYLQEFILNRPNKLNVVNLEMTKFIFDKIVNFVPTEIINNTELGYDKNLLKNSINSENQIIPKVIILIGQGNRSFCAGGDITALYNQMVNKEYKKIEQFYDYEILSDFCFTKMSPIQISIWNGYVMGGGLGLSANSRYRIATDNTVFAMPECAIGLFPDVGGAYFLTRMFNNQREIGLYCGLTGYRIEGEQCAISGAATHFVRREKLLNLKEEIISLSSIEILDEKLFEQQLDDLINKYSEITYSPQNFSFPNENLIKMVFQFDCIENIFKRLEDITNSKSDEFNFQSKEWAKSTLDKLNQDCPQSLVIFFELAKRALEFSDISQNYYYDLIIFKKIYEQQYNEFREGIRALLVDKDKNPNWKYKTIWDIKNKEEIIGYYFNA
jgi:3-hydroxyisobutyryl-CoA hydrolase